jgi:hypothetical protein
MTSTRKETASSPAAGERDAGVLPDYRVLVGRRLDEGSE